MALGVRLGLVLAVVVGQSACGNAASPEATADSERPAVIRAFEEKGLDVMGEFDAPGGLRGYAGLGGNGPVALYVMPDGEHVLVGTLLNAQGEDVSAANLQRLVVMPISERIWGQLEQARWVLDGHADAPRVVYAFTDANCPYCHRFWEASRRWIESGKVQIRHIMVGVIRPDSPNKAAAILMATSPSEALALNEERQAEGGIEALAEIPAETKALLDANEKLMVELGIQGTPGILYRDDSGAVQSQVGMPAPENMTTVLGPF